ncbi:autotransporter outer membrane beta-barrel domain-containing protein, partial [Aquabacter spiritensis]|uniref:autotransporter outer membrane beta-barrel domain-containing protein n=1 Tax=Aquabacter spiritensis TaxID=933073 RepID=UPI00105156C8
TGGLIKTGAGQQLLGGTNTFTGPLQVLDGNILLRGGAAIADSVAVSIGAAGGLILWDDETIGSLAGSGSVSAYRGDVTLTVGANDADTVFSGTLVDQGTAPPARAAPATLALVKTGAGTLTLTGTNTYSGGTTLSGGTLQIGDGGTAGSIAGDVANSGVLIFDRSDTTTFAGAVSGGGSLIHAGAGSLILTGENSFTGGTTIAGGRLEVGTGGTSGTLVGNVVDNGTLVFNRSDAVTFAGDITGSGSVLMDGTGSLSLTGTNTHSGGTVVNNGALVVNSVAALGSGGLTLRGSAEFATKSTFATSAPVTLLAVDGAGGGTVAVGAEATVTLSGIVSGAGGLTKAGEGRLVLTGANTYTGGTLISAGTLQIGDGGAVGAVVGDVVNNAHLVFNRSDDYVFSGAITGTGDVVFMGGGQVIFSAPYNGPVTVNASSVELKAGTVSGSAFTVNAGGRLGGSATIGSLTANSGSVIAPGYSPGTLTVSGPVTFNAGATYVVDVTPAGAHDLIVATGAVTLSSGAGVAVAAERGRFAAQTTYAIITTTAGVTGTFGTVTSDFAFLEPALSYDAQNVYLTLVYTGMEFIDFARTPNQATTAVAAQALDQGNPVFDAIYWLPDAAVPGALNALSGEAYASVDTVIQQQSVYVREAVGSRLRASVTAPEAGALGYAAQAGAPQTATLGGGLTPTLWAQGYGGWGNSFSNGNAASITNSLGGFLIGADVALAPHARAGLFGGFSQSQFDVTDRASSGSIDNYDLGAYAGAQFGAWALRGGVSYTWHDVSMTRAVAFAGFAGATEGGYTSGTTQVFGEVGYDVAIGAIALEPFAGLAYVNVSGGSLFEGGGSAAALSVDLEGMSTLYSTLGIRAATSLQLYGRTLTPSVTLGWQHAFGDTTPVATMLFAGGTTPFQVSGVPIAEDALLLGASLSYALSNVASLGVTYSGQLAATASQNAFTAQFALKF